MTLSPGWIVCRAMSEMAWCAPVVITTPHRRSRRCHGPPCVARRQRAAPGDRAGGSRGARAARRARDRRLGEDAHGRCRSPAALRRTGRSCPGQDAAAPVEVRPSRPAPSPVRNSRPVATASTRAGAVGPADPGARAASALEPAVTLEAVVGSDDRGTADRQLVGELRSAGSAVPRATSPRSTSASARPRCAGRAVRHPVPSSSASRTRGAVHFSDWLLQCRST
jgi:hypothetical protein